MQVIHGLRLTAFLHILRILPIRFRKWGLKTFLNYFFNRDHVMGPYAICRNFI
jgi:hypothetical protein